MDLHPGNWSVAFVLSFEPLNMFLVSRYVTCSMAVHTSGTWGNCGMGRVFNACMAILTVDFIIARMYLVVEGDGLVG
jgi:hypothetical protein